MADLIAYIPVLNQRHIDWLKKHRDSDLFLISQEMAETFLPRLARNISAVPATTMLRMLDGLNLVRRVWLFEPDHEDPDLTSRVWKSWILPDEDISHVVAESYLVPAECTFEFEMIWARWDMKAVTAAQPVIPDCEISTTELDVFRIEQADALTKKSPDWWRQIGAIAFRGSEILACGWNEHFPTEYETYIFGDPRLNFNAGDPAGMDAYVSLHAEEYLVAYCAEKGIALGGASLYINTFPCGRCARVIEKAGIKELFFREGSSFLKGFETLQGAGVRIVQVRKDPEPA